MKEIEIMIKRKTIGNPPRLDRYFSASVDLKALTKITQRIPMVIPHTSFNHAGDSASFSDMESVHRPAIAFVLESDAVINETNTIDRNTAILITGIGSC